MKKVFYSALVCLAAAVISCSCKEVKGFKAQLLSENEKIDTLSYIVGMDVANSIEKNMIPFFKINYDVMVETLAQALDPEATIKIEDETFTKENFREVGDKYMSNDFRNRVMEAQSDTTGNATIYADEKEKNIISAILGADIAYSATQTPFELEKRSLLTAINDIHNGKGRLTDEFAMEYTRNYFTVVLPENNRKESEEWLAGIEKKKGVKKTESGLLYKIENAGDENVKAINDEDVVKVIYTGRTKDGKVFDSNRWSDMPAERQEMIKAYQPDQAEQDNPIEFPLNRVIKGWTEGMKLVGKGGRITLWIPSELAYGQQGAGQNIGPNEALCFEVELLDVTSK